MTRMKEVDFYYHCYRCKHKKVPEYEDPCMSCLKVSSRENSNKPIKFEEGSSQKNHANK